MSDWRDYNWSRDDLYLSNGGAGPLAARILCIREGWAEMERWDTRRPNGRRTRFFLPMVYMMSPRCGWAIP